MLILSQKEKIINFNNIIEILVKNLTIYDIKCYAVVCETVNNKEKELGVYATEERAKEVLQEIIETYIDCNEQYCPSGVGYIKNKVYEMPKR